MEIRDDAITSDVRSSGAQEEESIDDRSSGYSDVGVSIAIAVALGVFVGALALRSNVKVAMEQRSSNTSSDAFCCPEHVEQLVAHINSSLDPCENFFEYSCLNSIHSNHKMRQPTYSQLEQFVSTGVPPDPKIRGGPAARFLFTYYQTCIRSTGRRDSFIPQMALSIVRATQDLIRRPNTRRSLMFMLEMAMKYRLPSILDVTYNARRSRLRLRVQALCDVGSFDDCLTSSVETVRSTMSPLLTIEETLEFMLQVCERFPDVDENRTYAMANATEAISEEVWNVRDIQDALNSVGWKTTEATVLEVIGRRRLRSVHDAFGSDRSCGVKAAYLLWHSVVEATINFLPSSKPSYKAAFSHCLRKARNIGDMWLRMKDEVAAKRETDDQVVSAFTTVKTAVLRDAASSSLFDANDVGHLRTLLERLTVVTPTADTRARSVIEVPQASSVFAENILRGSKYIHSLTHVSKGRPVKLLFLFEEVEIVDESRVEISPSLYDAVEPASPRSQFLNMATLGYSLAEATWKFLLRSDSWSPNTTANMDRLATCFAEKYGGSYAQIEDMDIVAASLALGSVVNTLAVSPHWRTVRIAWSTMYMSHAQLFYIMAATHRCPLVFPSVQDVRRVVTPMRYVEDFSVAFNCAGDTVMGTPQSCRIHA